MSPDSHWGENPRANSFYAAATIMRMNLKDPPKATDGSPETRLERIREWWGEIQAGKRVLSFASQDVGYCFAPDGSWQVVHDITNEPPSSPRQ